MDAKEKADLLGCSSPCSPLQWRTRAGQALGEDGEEPLAALPELTSERGYGSPGVPGTLLHRVQQALVVASFLKKKCLFIFERESETKDPKQALH